MTEPPQKLLGALVEGAFEPPDPSQPARPVALRIARFVGAGKFAWVFEAQDASGARHAVKMLYRDDHQALARFKREIKVIRALPAHPNRAAYRGHGQTGAWPWVAMDFIDGFTLGAVLRQNRPLESSVACKLMVQLCDGFNGLHRLGLTHRDINPDNIMITHADRAVKLMDFGLVQDSQGLLQLFEQADILAGADFRDDLDTGLIAGTPEYMAPEQISDPHVRERHRQKTDTTADIFALGVMFWQLVAGRQLFPYAVGSKGASGREGLIHFLDYRLTFTDAELERPAHVSPELWSILRKSLAHDPTHRQRDAAELARDLRVWLDTGQGIREEDLSATVATEIDLAKLRAMASANARARASDPPPDSGVIDTRAFQAIMPKRTEAPWAKAETIRDIPSDSAEARAATLAGGESLPGGAQSFHALTTEMSQRAPDRAVVAQLRGRLDADEARVARRRNHRRTLGFVLLAMALGAGVALALKLT
jgi:serine/threonine protein kinase